MTPPPTPPSGEATDLLRRALAEDLGRAGDITTNTVIPAAAVASAHLVARTPGRIAGLDWGLHTFTMVDTAVASRAHTADGDDVAAGDVLATITGPARAILTAERTCLNLVGHLSGIATATRNMCRLIADTGAQIADTRKTTPGLRALEKYAVAVGGGRNHRFGLDDAVLIKDNHLKMAGSIAHAVAQARSGVGHLVGIEVEVDTLDQLAEVLAADVDAVLLDNMEVDQLVAAVAMVDGRCTTEASGGVTPETVADIAATGVDLISSGWITHSAPSLDIALDFDWPREPDSST